jgi:hypothetical protein
LSVILYGLLGLTAPALCLELKFTTVATGALFVVMTVHSDYFIFGLGFETIKRAFT